MSQKVGLAQAKFIKVKEIESGRSGYNVYVKVVSVDKKNIQTKDGLNIPMVDCVVADETGSAKAFFKGDNATLIEKGNVIAIRNGVKRYVKDFISLEVDIFGRVTLEKAINIAPSEAYNISAIEHKLERKPRDNNRNNDRNDNRRPRQNRDNRDNREPRRDNRQPRRDNRREDRGDRNNERPDRNNNRYNNDRPERNNDRPERNNDRPERNNDRPERNNNRYNNDRPNRTEGAPRTYNKPEGERTYNKPEGASRTYNKPEGERTYNKPEGERTYNKPEGERTYNRPERRNNNRTYDQDFDREKVSNVRPRQQYTEKREQNRERRAPMQWTKISDIGPAQDKLNIVVKVISAKKIGNKFRCVLGDASGISNAFLHDHQDIVQGESIVLFNAVATVVKEHIEIQLTRYGKIDKSRKPVDKVSETFNLSDKAWVPME